MLTGSVNRDKDDEENKEHNSRHFLVGLCITMSNAILFSTFIDCP